MILRHTKDVGVFPLKAKTSAISPRQVVYLRMCMSIVPTPSWHSRKLRSWGLAFWRLALPAFSLSMTGAKPQQDLAEEREQKARLTDKTGKYLAKLVNLGYLAPGNDGPRVCNKRTLDSQLARLGDAGSGCTSIDFAICILVDHSSTCLATRLENTGIGL